MSTSLSGEFLSLCTIRLTEIRSFLGPKFFAYGLLWVVCETSNVWKVLSPNIFLPIDNALVL